ncbi:MAG TPA: TOMM precursor leader peptide-binding protein [Kofleriaceae bacterium]|nr:TOMM precursor leader peptide-binding protein [Kofleriaceae bacterium]
MMHRVLRFKHHLRAEVAGDELVFLIGDDAHVLLRGRPYALLAPILDGRRTIEQILAELAGAAPAPEIYYALRTLEERGHVAEVTPGLAPEAAGFWHALGSSTDAVADRLGRARLEVAAAGTADPGPVREALAGAGLCVAAGADANIADAGAPALRVVVTADYLHPDLAAHDRTARAAGARWLPIRPTGLAPWIGPLLGRPSGPCWSCLAHRLRWNRPVEAFLQRRSGDLAPRTPPRAALPASLRAAADLAALTLAWWLADGGTGAIDDHLLALELTELRAVRHRVTRRPQCAACGDPELIARRAHEPVALAARPKRFTADGGFRMMTPEETLARCEPALSPITGVLASLGPVPGRDHPLRPVYGAVYRIVPPGPSPGFDDFHRLTSGKGRTPAQARASALCEGLERVSAIFHGDEARLRAPRAALGDAAIHPHALQLFSDAQVRARTAAASPPDPKRGVPRPYRDDVELDWTPAWSLTHERRVYLPLAYCYQHAPRPEDLEVCGFNPNGHAAGNCLEEAILQGLLELVERDAVAIWWYNRLRRRAVALDGFGEPYAAALRDHYRALGWDLWVLDLTTDLEIPVFVALAHAQRPAGPRWSIGFGCHLDARLALQRALTELNQIFDPDEAAPQPWDPHALADPGYLHPDPAAPPAAAADFAPVTTDDLADDVRACLARAAARGHEVIVLDQTRPDLGLCAVKVVVPGLRHFWPRLGPGRLYDVPVALGLLAAPLAEDQLNPVPLFL